MTRSSPLFPLVVTLAIQVLVSMAAVTVPVLAPVAAAEINISSGLVGIFVALIYAAGMLSGLLSGNLIRKYGAIRVSQACLMFCAAGLWLATAGSLPLLVVSALLLGIGYGPVTPASSHILGKTTSLKNLSLVFSLKQTGVPLGGALAGAVVPALVLVGGWREAAMLVGLACIATAALAEPLRQMFDAERRLSHSAGFGGIAATLRLVLQDAAIRRLGIISFFFSAIQLCLVSYLVSYLNLTLGFSLLQSGLMLTVAQTAGILGRILWGALVGRLIRPERLFALLAFGMATATALTAGFSERWPLAGILLVSVLFGATAIGWNGVYLAEVAKLAPPGKISDATGGALFFTFSGVVVGPTLFALLLQQGFSYSTAYLLIGLPVMASGIWMLCSENSQLRPIRNASRIIRSGDEL